MTNKILLYCRPKCKTCKGRKFIKVNPIVGCFICKGKGYTDSVMELKWTGHSFDYRPNNEGDIGLYILRFETDGSLFIATFDKDGKYIANVTDSLNPTHLEVKKEKYRKWEYERDKHGKCIVCGSTRIIHHEDCDECSPPEDWSRKIEVVTQKVLFNLEETNRE